MTTRPGIELPGPGDDRGRSGLRRSGSVRPPPGAALAPGTIVAQRYRLIQAIGQGGMGVVYRAEQVAMKREVALKVMHASAGQGGGAATTQRFEREAQAASRITSPHVVTIHDFGHGEDDVLYLAMELLTGESLGHRILRTGALPWHEAVAIAIQIARALQVAHGAGVIHRDLKPDNIFLVTDDTGAGQVKVLDFGIARLMTDGGPASATLTSADLVVGTPLYMSPEACSRGAIGPGADLYSLGVILFEMITGKPPFDEREPVLVMSRHLEARPPRMRERRPDLDIPLALDELVDRLLRKKPAERPGSATEVASELRKLADSTARISAPPADAVPIRAEPTLFEGSTGAPARPGRASHALIAGAVAAALGLAALVALAIGLAIAPGDPGIVAQELPAEPSPASTPPPVPSPATVEVRFEIAPDDAIVLADGRAIEGHTLTLPRDGETHAIEIRADGYEPRTTEVRADVDRVVSIDLAPSGRAEGAPARATKARPRRGGRGGRATTKRRDPILRQW